MANVILKDASGNDVEYSGVTVIEVPVASTAGEVVTNRFTVLSSTKVYVISRQDDGNYLVLKELQRIPSQYCVNFGLYDSDFEELNEDAQVMGSGKIWYDFLLTTKTLTVGETYAFADMY